MNFATTLLEDILPRVEKPSRYLGNELNAIRKEPRPGDVRIALTGVGAGRGAAGPRRGGRPDDRLPASVACRHQELSAPPGRRPAPARAPAGGR